MVKNHCVMLLRPNRCIGPVTEEEARNLAAELRKLCGQESVIGQVIDPKDFIKFFNMETEIA